ncbi:DNA-binding transcriptional regulator, ArsR family [Pseudarthrobacter equi]|uniref:DNA-binding transcriptional regulator, ArsR family n=1 Tax=Pseudarthrobacter equi TaxID=728066 RepID=A0A1H1WQZ3_9MICC|nr:metalloregulator ArsR/SmtB family transcription factor [Pseudarthrobacter equi]SDS98756.1 DNA-binding transcriptional regulator, ArsR family [Pseudarthrobacter equi]
MDDLSAIFLALADPTRRALLAQLQRGEATVTELAAPHSISVPSVSRHLKVLEEAGLITKSRSAQWRRCRLQPAPLQQVEEWLRPYRDFLGTRLDRLDAQLAMDPARPNKLTELEDR